MLTSLILTAGLGLVPGPAPQASASRQETGETPASESSARPRPTILHLQGGAVLRTRAREVEGGWEVQQGKDWQRIPGGRVERAVPEKELLSQSAKLARTIPREDLVRRIAYTDWLVTEGLHVEALEELDRVLAKDPDQPDALALIQRADLPLALPQPPLNQAGLETFLSAAARLSPAAREAAVQRLAAAPEIPGLRETLAAELSARTTGRRTLATLVLRRMFPGTQVEELLGRAILDPSAEVRTQAALTLRSANAPAVIVPALRALGSPHAIVRSNAIEALATMNYAEAVEPLYERLTSLQSGSGGGYAPRVHIFNGRQIAYVQDFDVEVAQGQSIADPIINVLAEGSVLDVAVRGVHDYSVASERSSLRRALSSLTGADPGSTTVAWEKWWKEHGDEWRVGTSSPSKPTTPSGRGG